MTRKYDTVTKEIEVSNELVEVTCDLCGSKANQVQSIGSPSWTWGGCGSSAATFKYWYSIDGDLESYEFDLCPDCGEKIMLRIKTKTLFNDKP